MESSQRTDELIQKYLDHGCSTAESDELEQLLRADPKAAEAFAAATRLDAALGAVFGEQQAASKWGSPFADLDRAAPAEVVPAVPRRWRATWRTWSAVAAAGVLLLVVGGGIWLHRFRGLESVPEPAPLATGENQVLSGEAFVQGAPTRFIREDTAFEVSSQASAAIRLGDGSRAEFDPASQAVLRGREEGARQVVEILDGGGTFSVAKAEQRFQVQTSIGTVTALGTEFTVRLLPAEIRGNPATNLKRVLFVAVLSGLVQVDFADRSYVLTGGESRVFGKEKESREPRLGELRGALSAIGANEITVANKKEKHTLDTTLRLAPDCPVTIDGKQASAQYLTKGMPVLVQRQEGAPVAVNIRAEGPSVGGEVVAVDSNAGTIVLAGQRGEGGKGSDRSLKLAPDPKVTINGEPGRLEQIQPGAKVALKLSARDGRTVVEIVMGHRKESGKRDGETREGIREGRERTRGQRD